MRSRAKSPSPPFDRPYAEDIIMLALVRLCLAVIYKFLVSLIFA